MRFPVNRGMGYQLIPGVNVPSSGELLQQLQPAIAKEYAKQVTGSPAAQQAALDAAGSQIGVTAVNWVMKNQALAMTGAAVLLLLILRPRIPFIG